MSLGGGWRERAESISHGVTANWFAVPVPSRRPGGWTARQRQPDASLVVVLSHGVRGASTRIPRLSADLTLNGKRYGRRRRVEGFRGTGIRAGDVGCRWAWRRPHLPRIGDSREPRGHGWSAGVWNRACR